MLLSVSPFLVSEAQRAFRAPSRLLFALLLVTTHLSNIDAVARPLDPPAPAPGSSAPIQFIHVNFPPAPAPANSPAPGPIRFVHHDLHEFDPAQAAPATPLFVHTHSHGYISNDITLHGHRTKDGDMSVYLSIGDDKLCGVQCPTTETSTLLGFAHFLDSRHGRAGIIHSACAAEQGHCEPTWDHAARIMTMLLSVHTITQPTFDSWSEKLRYAKETAEIPQTKWHEWDTQRRLKNALTRLWELEIFLVEYVTAQGNEDKTGTVCLLFDSNPYGLKLELEMGNSVVMEGDPTLIGDATFADTKSKDDFHTFATITWTRSHGSGYPTITGDGFSVVGCTSGVRRVAFAQARRKKRGEDGGVEEAEEGEAYRAANGALPK
ncbi:hypothetical protein EV361DRAFT_873946 [Lentinula raphanica]|nr:hypothetical protein EV361DRAFT_873946 [Lentinula raphanica]